LKVCAMMVPRELKVEQNQGVKAMSDEELEQAIEILQAMIEQRLGEDARIIQGIAEPQELPSPNVVSTGPNTLMDALDKRAGPRARKPRKLPSPAGT
jgi:hypothetical protein